MSDFCTSTRLKIIPAIDLLQGEAVRLYQGSYDEVTSYSKNPVDIAKQFEKEGAGYLHLVDLDAARWQGDDPVVRQNNREMIGQICRFTAMKVEVGGGIRSEDDVQELIDLGVDRLIIGTMLVENPSLLARWVQRFAVEFIAGIDAFDGEVRIRGWEKGGSLNDESLANRVADLGIKGIVYTNISKDGTLQGPDITSSLRIAEASGLPVTVSGGMGNMDDCAKLVAVADHYGGAFPIDGVIIGKALYEGGIDLAEAIRLYQED